MRGVRPFSCALRAVTSGPGVSRTTRALPPAPPVALKPAVAGHWIWVGTNGVVFNPDGQLPRATEYTVGANATAAMPAMLPPISAYTYAAELSVDEAIAAGAACN